MEKQWPTWLVSYNFDGAQYSITVVARDAAEAKRRLATAAAWGDVNGELMATIPISRGGFLVPLVCWVRNFFRREGGTTPG